MFEKKKVVESIKDFNPLRDLEHCPNCGSGDIGFAQVETHMKFHCKDCDYRWDVLNEDEINLIRQEAVEEFIKARKR